MTTITIKTNDKEQINALKAFLKALKIKFEMSKEEPYNPEFVAEILESKEQVKNGKFKAIKTEDLWK